MDEHELEQYFAEQPKPKLRPFLAARVVAVAGDRPRRVKTYLYLIWTAVLVGCVVASAHVRVPTTGVVVALAALFPVALKRSRQTLRLRFVSLLLTGQNGRRS